MGPSVSMCSGAGGGVEEQFARHAGLPGDVASGAGRTGVETAPAAAAATLGHRRAEIERQIGEHGGEAYLGAGLGRDEEPGLADPAQAGPGGGRLVGEDAGGQPVARLGQLAVDGRGGADGLVAALPQRRDERRDGVVEQAVQAAVLGPVVRGVALLEPQERMPVDARDERDGDGQVGSVARRRARWPRRPTDRRRRGAARRRRTDGSARSPVGTALPSFVQPLSRQSTTRPQAAARKRRRRRLLPTTVTLERPMAAAAKIGFSRMPNGG